MDSLENFIFTLDNLLDSDNKRHITGGLLLSVSAFFGGLAITVMTIERKKQNE